MWCFLGSAVARHFEGDELVAWGRTVASEVGEALEAQSSVEDCLSFPHAHAAQHAGSSGSEVRFETSSWRVGMSLTVEGGAHVAHTAMRQLEEAWFGTGSEADSTLTVAYAAMVVGHRCFCADHVERGMRLKLESWIEAYDRTLGGKEVSAFVLRPSCLRYLNIVMLALESRRAVWRLKVQASQRKGNKTYRRMCIRLWHLVCCKGLGDCNS